ncbi:RNA ligase family protein, partial [Salinicola sp. 4072]|uniref:RNA ligase family protein n=1 Tax=Salinicola sp. 4072 TaxID=3082157 RepID=UPI002FC945A8
MVEEKLDGANLGISWGDEGQLRVQNRGAYLEAPYRGQFSRLNQWLMQHLAVFQQHLPDHVILFGEWCAARHSLDYAALPDWFLVFDVFDRKAKRFWNQERRNALASRLGLAVVPRLMRGRFTVKKLEGVVVKCFWPPSFEHSSSSFLPNSAVSHRYACAAGGCCSNRSY